MRILFVLLSFCAASSCCQLTSAKRIYSTQIQHPTSSPRHNCNADGACTEPDLLLNRLEYASRYSGNTALETSASQPPKGPAPPPAPSELSERFPQRASLAQAPSTAIEHSAATGPAHSAHCVERVAHPPPPNVQPAVMVSSKKRGDHWRPCCGGNASCL